MPDPDPQEIAAMEHASDMAGEYLESLPSTDLAGFTPDAWQTLIAVICGAYADKLAEVGRGAAARTE